MSRSRSRPRLVVPILLAVALAAPTVLVACSGKDQRDRVVSTDAARDLLVDRNWLDRMPAHKDDRLHVYRFIPSMGNSGVYQDRRLFVGQLELFLFEIHGDEVRIQLPDTEDTQRTRFRIERIDGPRPFDLELTLPDSPRGPKVYYGMSSETASTLHELDEQLAALIPGDS